MLDRLSRAAREAVLVTIIAILVSALVYGAGYRQLGSDLSQRILVAAGQSPFRFVPQPERRASPPRSWVFIDISLAPCSSRGSRCDRSAELRGERLARLLRRTRDAGPRLVIVDVLVAGGQAASSTVDPQLEAELGRPGPPVLLAWGAPPSFHEPDRPLIHVDASDALLMHPRAYAHARFLPAVIGGGPVSRDLVPAVCLQEEEGPPHVVPTLSYGAAMIALNAGFDRIDGYLQGGAPVRTAGDPNACRSLPGLSASSLFSLTERVFSAGSLRSSGDQMESSYWPSAGLWLHFRTAANGDYQIPDRVLTDGIAVIGSSAADAGDMHWTSLGQMIGGEIVLNDIRQYVLSAPQPQPYLWEELIAKLPFFLVGAIAAWFVALVPLSDHARPASSSLVSRVAGATTNAIVSGVRLLSLLVLTGFLFFLLLWLLPQHLGSPPDFVTPFLALAAEGLFGLAFHIVRAARVMLRLDEAAAIP